MKGRKAMKSKMELLLVLLIALTTARPAVAECDLPFVSIKTATTGLTISGCYNESTYDGLFETMVYTIEGRDLAEMGTTAIVADIGSDPDAGPVWAIGTVVSMPENSWSDGKSAGLQVVDLQCVSNTTFWETADPTEVGVWQCDTNGDGVLSVSESGDFQQVTCGCPSPAGLVREQTPSPTFVIVNESTPSPVGVIAGAPTSTPVISDTDIPGTTQEPSSMGDIAEEARACNLTLASDILVDITGCYVGRVSSNSRGRWTRLDDLATIEWKTDGSSSGDGFWAIEVGSFDAPDDIRCVCSEDVDDPSIIEAAMWRCDVDGDDVFSAAERGKEFQGLLCSQEVCGQVESVGTTSTPTGSGSDDFRKNIMIALGTSGALMVGALLVFVIVVVRRTRRRAAQFKVEITASEGALPATSGTPTAEIQIFQPWGTRDPPCTYKIR